MKLLLAILGFCCSFRAVSQGQSSVDFTIDLRASSEVLSGAMNLVGTNLLYHVADNEPYLAHPNALEIHGPAGPNATAPPIYSLGFCIPGPPPFPGQEPPCDWAGTLGIPEFQIAELLAGLWYVQWGKLRAQILPVDSDGDGLPDYLDQCAHTPAGEVVDPDGCSIGDLCPCDGPWNNHGEYVSRLVAVSGEFVKAGLITEAEQRRLVSRAATSDCGKGR